QPVAKPPGAGARPGWLSPPAEMIPAFQGFLFGGGVNPFASRVATYFLRDHLQTHVALLVDAYRKERDATLRGLHEVLDGSGAEISKPEGGFFLWIRLPERTDQRRLSDLAATPRVPDAA